MSTQYNGWTNYETWNVKLWIDNDEGLHEFTEQAPDLGATCWADLLNAALSEVNWHEIAASMVNDAKERATEAA